MFTCFVTETVTTGYLCAKAALRRNFSPIDGYWREWLIDLAFFARVNLFTYIDSFARYNASSFPAAMLGVNLISDII